MQIKWVMQRPQRTTQSNYHTRSRQSTLSGRFLGRPPGVEPLKLSGSIPRGLSDYIPTCHASRNRRHRQIAKIDGIMMTSRTCRSSMSRTEPGQIGHDYISLDPSGCLTGVCTWVVCHNRYM